MLRRLVSVIAFFLVSLGASPSAAQVFDGFTAMTFPQTEVPIGARWLPGVGPDGPATNPSNITVSRGLSGATLNRELKASITGGLASFLGLRLNVIRTEAVTYSNLSVHRVSDLSVNGNIGAGEQILQQAIKAGQVLIRTSTSGAAEIQASAQARGLPVTVTSDGNGGSQVALDGSDLFVAYQVVEFRQGQVRSREARYNGEDDITFDNTWRVRICCAGPEYATVEVQNLRSISGSGNYTPQRFEHWYQRNRDTEYTLRTIREGQTIVANLLRVRIEPLVVCGTFEGRDVCFPPAWNHSRQTLRLTTTRMEIVPVRRPRGVF